MAATVDKTRLITLPELAEWLQVPTRSIYSWRSQGAGPRGIKVGRSLRFRVSDVERWLESNSDEAE